MDVRRWTITVLVAGALLASGARAQTDADLGDATGADTPVATQMAPAPGRPDAPRDNGEDGVPTRRRPRARPPVEPDPAPEPYRDDRAVPLPYQEPPPDTRPEPPRRGVGGGQAVERLLRIENRIIQTQLEMLQTLHEATARAEAPEPMDPAMRKAAIRKALLYNRQLERLRKQIPRIKEAVERMGDEIPIGAREEISRLRGVIEKNQGVIARRHARLRELYRERRGEDEESDEELEEDLEKLEDEAPSEEFEEPDLPADPEAEPIPEDTAEAAKLLEEGGITTPAHLTAVFERIELEKTPTSSLSRFRPYFR